MCWESVPARSPFSAPTFLPQPALASRAMAQTPQPLLRRLLQPLARRLLQPLAQRLLQPLAQRLLHPLPHAPFNTRCRYPGTPAAVVRSWAIASIAAPFPAMTLLRSPQLSPVFLIRTPLSYPAGRI